MENTPRPFNEEPPNESNIQPAAGNPDDTILSDIADMSGYDKSLKQARIWLYVICVMQVGMGVYEYFQYDTMSDAARWVTFGVDAGIGLIFLACALWSYKKPVAAFLTALIFYIVVSAGLMIINPANITFGIIIKILVIIALFRAYKDAKGIEEMKQTLGG